VANEGDPNVASMLIHEIGHAYFDLGDEYGVSGETNCSLKTAVDKAERFDNLTLSKDEYRPRGLSRSSDAREIYWEDMYTMSPIDADFDEHERMGYDFSALEEEVSLFVGGGTCRRRVSRGALQCRMHSHTSQTWCPVCERLVEEKFDEWQADAGDSVCPSRWADDGICDRCLGDDPDCCRLDFGNLIGSVQCFGREDSCGNGVCNALTGETNDNCAEDCGTNVCGDGLCRGSEDAESCAEDCGCASVASQYDVTPMGCFCGPDCAEYGDCCADSCDAFGNGCDA